MILIVYTTIYRKGGKKFELAAKTMEKEKQHNHPNIEVHREPVNSKSKLRAIFNEIHRTGKKISEFHFFGHSGMYGPMFGTTSWPEQFSPYEWRMLKIPFALKAKSYFHACRTARWFAPFFSRTFGITTYGYHLYTSFSYHPDSFRWKLTDQNVRHPLYIVSCPGKRSHGLLASILKYSGFAKNRRMIRFDPETVGSESTYNHVAELYDKVFSDITVRMDEWKWILSHVPQKTKLRVLDIGCGNGALLYQLSDLVCHGTGVDISSKLIDLAKRRCAEKQNLSFTKVDGPILPFAGDSFDLVVAMLSFRYLDWDPIMSEIARVLSSDGRLLIIDMVASPVKFREFPKYVIDKGSGMIRHFRRPEFRTVLKQLVSTPDWKTMLRYNPIRDEHEYRWYLGSRFPGRKVEILNLGWHSRVIAFDSGPMANARIERLTYP